MSSFASLLGAYANKSNVPKVVVITAPTHTATARHPLYETLLTKWQCMSDKNVNTSVLSTLTTQTSAINTSSANSKDNNDGNEGSNGTNSMTGIGILLIIIDKLPHEAIWRAWISQYEKSTCTSLNAKHKVKVWIHAKYPDNVTSKWVKDRLVTSFQLKPEWGSIEITDVMYRMLKESVAPITDSDESCFIEKFIYASESCIPITPLHEVMSLLLDDPEQKNVSWVNYTDKPNNGYALQLQFDQLYQVMPKECIYKADQWVLISRRHALEVISLADDLETIQSINSNDSKKKMGSNSTSSSSSSSSSSSKDGSVLVNLFRKVRASDEMFFPCSLAVLGHIKPLSVDSSTSIAGVVKRPVTYCDWTAGGKNPKTFDTLSLANVMQSRGAGSILFRKLKMGNISSKDSKEFLYRWYNIVYNNKDTSDSSSSIIDFLDDIAIDVGSDAIEIDGNKAKKMKH